MREGEISYGVRKVKPSKSLRIYLFCHHAAQELIASGIPFTIKTTRGKIWP
jgi:hypothetical protein